MKCFIFFKHWIVFQYFPPFSGISLSPSCSSDNIIPLFFVFEIVFITYICPLSVFAVVAFVFYQRMFVKELTYSSIFTTKYTHKPNLMQLNWGLFSVLLISFSAFRSISGTEMVNSFLLYMPTCKKKINCSMTLTMAIQILKIKNQIKHKHPKFSEFKEQKYKYPT